MKTHDRSLVLADFALGSDQAETPEGFLLCRNVPIARVGIQDYLNEELVDPNDEVPLIGGKDGVIHVERRPEDVFHEDTIRSFEGKDVTDDHPDDLIGPHTHREVTVGVVINPRRGEGHLERYLIADLLIKDADAIAAVRAGKREVSCGYDASYEQIAPGKARQHNIVGNHVALVEKGRCGPSCAIGDQAMAEVKKLSLFDRAMAALTSGGADAMKAVLTKDEEGAGISSTPNMNFHIHNGGGPAGATTLAPVKDEKEEKEEKGEKKEGMDEEMPPWAKKMTDSLESRFKKIEDRLFAKDAESEAEEEIEEEGEGESEGDVEDAEPEEEMGMGSHGKDKKAAKDALAVRKQYFQAIVSGAEVLAPGLKLPTFDAKMGGKATVDAGCVLKRRALMAHAHTKDGADNISSLLGGKKKLDLKAMTCDAVGILFNGAVAMVTQDSMTVDLSAASHANMGGKPIASISEFNKAKAGFYKN
jgi:hypothetical protein